MAVPILYKDLNREISIVHAPVLLENEDAVLNSIVCILGTERGEREFLPEFGSVLSGFLQDPIDDETAYKIRTSLIFAIERWEPRVSIDQSRTVVKSDRNMQGYHVKLAVKIAGLPTVNTYRLFMKQALATG